MKELPEITVSDWMEAEALSGIKSFLPREPNSKTAAEYAEEKGLSEKTARAYLYQMTRKGVLDCRNWHDGEVVRKIYWPKINNNGTK